MNKSALLLLLFFFSCKKDDNSGSSTPAINYIWSNNISGITEIDQNGNLFGNIDKGDWSVYDRFAPSINALFNFADTIDYSQVDTSTISIVQFPNPAQDLFKLFIKSSNMTVVKYVMVDANFHIYFQGTLLLQQGSNLYNFDFSDPSFTPGKLYRIYYKFYKSDHTSYESGHGDIQKQT